VVEIVDENLKSHPKPFWKYVASFRKRNSASIQLEVGVEHFKIKLCPSPGKSKY
jgi:hypothetical protein